MSESFSTVVCGGGAAGMMAAISSRRAGRSVVICERMSSPGKKILASGNGRCNLLNERLAASRYNTASQKLVQSIFDKFGKSDIENFFKSLGLELYREEAGRIFPATNQSASVLKALEIESRRLSIPIELNFEVAKISASAGGFTVTSRSGRSISSKQVILAGGGKSYPALGSNGSAYALAEAFGHTIIEPVPSAVSLVVKDGLCHALQGQRILSKVSCVIGTSMVHETLGDLLFTKYGLSGTAILDLSEDVSVAINRQGKKDVVVSADMVPFMNENGLRAEIAKRIKDGRPAEELLVGILPNKFGPAMKVLLSTKDAGLIAASLKARNFKITATRGWNEAEFTAGGVDTGEIKEATLESKIKEGLYFAGEILDVTGARGGYNLAWAWASGYVAGLGR